jgi:hypothetical protein
MIEGSNRTAIHTNLEVSICGETEAVACAAEMVAHRCDEANLPNMARHLPRLPVH